MKIILLSKKQRQISNSYFTGWQGYTKCTKVGLCTLTGPSTNPPPIISLSIYQFILNKTVINKYTRKLARRNVCLLHSFKVRDSALLPTVVTSCYTQNCLLSSHQSMRSFILSSLNMLYFKNYCSPCIFQANDQDSDYSPKS